MKPAPGRAPDSLQAVCFSVAGAEYAVDIMAIKEIIDPRPVTPVPRAPAFVEGIIELRGAILPVVDLRRRFDRPALPLTREGKYVIAAVAGRVLALIVDRVRDVTRVATAEVRPPPALAIGPGAGFVAGVFQRDDQIVMLVDLAHVLGATEQQALREV